MVVDAMAEFAGGSIWGGAGIGDARVEVEGSFYLFIFSLCLSLPGI